MGFGPMEMLEEGISGNSLSKGMDVEEGGAQLRKHAKPSLSGA